MEYKPACAAVNMWGCIGCAVCHAVDRVFTSCMLPPHVLSVILRFILSVILRFILSVILRSIL
jgi:succinate dehydrogenase/fumarate reductase-like Fe-S protein